MLAATKLSSPNNKATSRIYSFALIIASVIAIAPPVGYLLLSYQSQANETDVKSRLYAAFITQVIHSSPNDWREAARDLIDQELVHSEGREARYVTEPNGNLIAKNKDTVQYLLITRSTTLTDADGRFVGRVYVAHSFLPIIQGTALIAVAGLTLGAAIFAILHLLPLRTLRQTLIALQNESEAARESERRLSVIIENAAEGIIAMTPDGIVQSVNAAAARMFGYAETEIIGQNVARFLSLSSEHGNNQHYSTAVHRNGTRFPIEMSLSKATMAGAPQLICIIRDITERKRAEQRLTAMANYDSLTSLPNRNLFHERLVQALHRAERNNTRVALIFLDLDGFKTINDTLGHAAGDVLLQHVARLLVGVLRKTDLISRDTSDGDNIDNDKATVARLGGDEFTIILEGLHTAQDAAIVATKIIQSFTDNPAQLGTHQVYASASIGIAVSPVDDRNKDTLIKNADNAMYRAKRMGRNNYQFFTLDLATEVSTRFQLESELRHALKNSEFVLHYQPKVDINSGAIVGSEALIRWCHPKRGIVPPGEFLHVLEETAMIIPVGEWVLRSACAQVGLWRQQGLPALSIAVNLSARQIEQAEFLQSLVRILNETGLDPALLELELTENMLIADADLASDRFRELANIGVRLAIDDFGTGYSSLNYLKRFSIHTLKIDRSFVKDIATDTDDAAIATAVIALGKSLNMTIVAEGVEMQEQHDRLRSLGCDLAQGYMFGKPMPADEFFDHVSSYQSRQIVRLAGAGRAYLEHKVNARHE